MLRRIIQMFQLNWSMKRQNKNAHTSVAEDDVLMDEAMERVGS